MYIRYAKNCKENYDLNQNDDLSAVILDIVYSAALDNPMQLDLKKSDNYYANEDILYIFHNDSPSFLSYDFYIITNFRILAIDTDYINNILDNKKLEKTVDKNYLLSKLDTIKSKKSNKGLYYVDITGNDDTFPIKSSNPSTSKLIETDITPLLFKLNDRIVKAYNKTLLLSDNQLDVNSITISPKEKPFLNAEQRIPFPTDVEKENSAFEMQSRVRKTKHNAPQVAFGPAPEGYHLDRIAYSQGQVINVINENGNFIKAMQRAIDSIEQDLAPDEMMCNIKFQTQNMEETLAVNLGCDIYKKDKK
ncbi:hypothetical protein KZE55_02060 [Limosilactobacillus panis]|uniref:hypothetical protein n=1 Tax=Limosilactobacillus panis TaxID=47493 RepID=UPI001C96DFE6|nr:hypothetical protein [Limosilactobacillus panis]QZN93374.1 hypothetical protein KZE55_02060 [Limosilactobacillus panis]